MSRKSKNKSDWMASPGSSAGPALNPPIAAKESAAGDAPTRRDFPGAQVLWWQTDVAIAIFFFVAILVVYSGVLTGEFVWDDDAYISKNETLRTLHGLWQIWFQPNDSGHQYYPLSFTGFWLGWNLWGMHTVGYHLVNICLHSVGSVLLWRILKRLKVPGALLGGALFALHPVNVMSVAWMNEMKNTLSGALALGSILAYLYFEGLDGEAVPQTSRRAWGWYAAMALLFVLAMLAKTAVSFLPVSLLLLVWWQRDRIGWREIWPLLPMMGIVAGMGRLTIHVEHKTAGAVGAQFTLNFGQKLIISGHSFFFYLGKLLLPVNLSFVYTRWQVSAWDLGQYLYPLAMVAVLAGLWLLRRRIGKGAFAAAMHFYICTSFLIFMVVLYRMRYSFVSDHWQYFGSISVFAFMGAVFAKGWERLGVWARPYAGWPAGALLTLLGALTWYQCGMFESLDSLWRWTIARDPNCWMAENNLGFDLLERGQVDESMGHLQRAITLKPDYVLAMNNLGKALMEENKVNAAIGQFQKALAIDPHDEPNNALEIETLDNLGSALLGKGRTDDAIGYYQKALAIDPDYLIAHINLADAFLKKGRVEEAIGQLQKTVEIMPDFVPALNKLAWLLATTGDARLRNGAKALEFAQRANQVTKNRNAVVLDTLAAAYAEQRQFSQAMDAERQAIAIAAAQRNTANAGSFKQHFALFKAGQPLREK